MSGTQVLSATLLSILSVSCIFRLLPKSEWLPAGQREPLPAPLTKNTSGDAVC